VFSATTVGSVVKPQHPISEIVSSANRRHFTHWRRTNLFMPLED